MDPLEIEFTVACDTARAFSLWAEQTTRWWPPGHSVSTEVEVTFTRATTARACGSSIAAGSAWARPPRNGAIATAAAGPGSPSTTGGSR